MSYPDRENDAIDALIVRAFRGESPEEFPDLAAPFVLSAEDKEALDKLGPDLVDRILSGDYEVGE